MVKSLSVSELWYLELLRTQVKLHLRFPNASSCWFIFVCLFAFYVCVGVLGFGGVEGFAYFYVWEVCGFGGGGGLFGLVQLDSRLNILLWCLSVPSISDENPAMSKLPANAKNKRATNEEKTSTEWRREKIKCLHTEEKEFTSVNSQHICQKNAES